MRLILEGMKIAYTALATNKLRTFLTLLGNIVGIMSVIAVASLLRGIDNYARETVAEEGSNVLKIQRFNTLEAITDFDRFLRALKHNPPIRRSDVEALRSSLHTPQYVSVSITTRSNVAFLDKRVRGCQIKGQDEYYPFIDNIDLYAGRHLVRLDVQTNAPIVIVGWEIYTKLIKPREPIGATIKLGARHFEVVGVAEEKGSILGQSQDRFVLVPIGAYQKVFGGGESVDIRVRTKNVDQLSEAVEEARVAMRIRHHLRPADEDDFYISTSAQLVSLWKQISGGIMLALFVLVSISMVVGGIVLMNTMLVAVTERTREVGIRKALGARRIDIVWQFLVESSTLSFFGGLFGMLIGMFIALSVSVLTPIPYSFDAVIVLIAFTVTIAVGLIFGTYPAVRAAMLNPVDALRHER
ncbi:MAG: ABC transporter permease [Candidatus Krumholzibacteria bacterium]|nr:ABC transporter permease [Candidatus Krumholzibacteria bacterium]